MQVAEGRFNGGISRRTRLGGIKVDYVDVVTCAYGVAVDRVPDGVADESRADPAIGQRQILDRLEQPHHVALPRNEVNDVFDGFQIRVPG
jgi:hypothetical protein